MADGRVQDAWQRTSHLMALLANVNRDPKKSKVFSPSDFDPFRESVNKKQVVVVTKENIGEFRKAFIGAKKK